MWRNMLSITYVNSLRLLIREFSLQVKTTFFISHLRIIICYTMLYVYNVIFSMLYVQWEKQINCKLTTWVSSVVLMPKKLEIWRKKNCANCIRAKKKKTKNKKQILCHESEPNPSKDRTMHEGDNPLYKFTFFLTVVLFIFVFLSKYRSHIAGNWNNIDIFDIESFGGIQFMNTKLQSLYEPAFQTICLFIKPRMIFVRLFFYHEVLFTIVESTQ
jgi:hypothetical protein